ncbi:MAG: YdjY domain-containing protein [Planctomycetota bacterium]
MPNPYATTVLTALLSAACVFPTMAQPDSEPPDQPGPRDLSPLAAETDTPPDDPVAQIIDAFNADDNGITIDRDARTVDIDAKVCLRECEFLEQLACSPDTREHESLLVLQAKPSMVHTALLLLGLEPGSPLQWIEEEDSVRTIPPRGPEIEVLILTTDGEGREVLTPANEWVKDQNSGETMQGNTWLFAGSKFVEVNGQEMYVADAYGTAISLVNFGDDLLARATDMTDSNESHGRVWGANTDAIPEVGTEVRLRLHVPEAAPPADAGPPSEE